MVMTRSKKTLDSTDFDQFREEMRSLIKNEIMNTFATHVKESLQCELVKIVAPINEQVSLLKSENEKLRVELNHLSVMCNANEQYSRKYNLRVGGIKEEPGEDCYKQYLASLVRKWV